MKISVTDKFLWEIYNVLKKTADVADFFAWPTSMVDKLYGLENPIFKKYRHAKNKRKFNNLVYYLKRRGYIKIRNSEAKSAIILTKEGMDKALRASFDLEEKEIRKDGKLIMLIFDIPQKNSKKRDLLRSILKNLGYKLFQQSVWVTPYDVLEKTEKLIRLHSLDGYIKMFIIEKI